MDKFTAIVLGTLTAAVLWVLWAAWLGRKLSLGQIVDKRRNERWATQMMIEEHDLPQMLAAANEYRRKRGLEQVTLEQLHGEVRQDFRAQIAEEARKQRRAKVVHGSHGRERRGF